jgi:2-keto-3-deoxy-L-rhamnonate aldolase RhmA
MTEKLPIIGMRAQIASGNILQGCFAKTPSSSAIEILGIAGFDFIVIDQEHGPFDRNSIDVALLAAKAVNIPAIVRIPPYSLDSIQAALDGGATGILAPHIDSAEQAEKLVSACRYRKGSRGFSSVTRAGNYGEHNIRDHTANSDAKIAVIAMIESPTAIDNIEEIVSVENLDAIFIGRGDLTVALDAPSRDSPNVLAAVDKIFTAARASGKPIWMMANNIQEAEQLTKEGATAFIISSDQALLRKACVEAVTQFKQSFD